MDNSQQPQLPKDFFKQFKNKEEFHSFFNNLFKQGVEQMLQAELDEHLGYEKHSKEGHNSGNSRNGSYSKKVKTESLGDMVLNIPRDRNSEFSPQLDSQGPADERQVGRGYNRDVQPGNDYFRYQRSSQRSIWCRGV